MSKGTAGESQLGELHLLVATTMISRIKNPETCTAADLNAAIKFLKDNNITATPEGNSALDTLRSEVLNAGTAGTVSAADEDELQRALDNVVAFRGSVANA